jgi:hypothetical protein
VWFQACHTGRVPRVGFPFGRWEPSPQDLAVLEACLLDDDVEAKVAFDQWADSHADRSRLHPLLLAACRRKGWSHPAIDEVRSQVRPVATFSMLVRHHGIVALAELASLGLRPVVLKGLALQETVYSTGGERPITDVDLLLSESEAVVAVNHLRKSGWTSPTKECFGPGMFASYAGANFGRGPYEQLDVHWRVNHWCRAGDLSAKMIQRSVPLSLDGVAVHTLDPTDHLLHAIAHGMAWESGASVRWVPDAVLLIRTGEIDWDRFVEDIARSGFGPAASEAIQFLSVYLGIDIPDSVRHGLADRFPIGDRVVHWIRSGPPTGRRLAARLLVSDYLVRTSGASTAARLMHYPRFIAQTVRGSQTHRLR